MVSEPTACAQAECIADRLFAERRIAEALQHSFLCSCADPGSRSLLRWECWMLLGEFEKAWQESDRGDESPWRSRVKKRYGEVLVRSCRGIGDAIQFLRYAPELKRSCERLRVAGPARQLPLLEF